MPMHRSIASIGAMSSLAVVLLGGAILSVASTRADDGDLDAETALVRRASRSHPSHSISRARTRRWWDSEVTS